MSDIMFLAKKEFDGKLRSDEGFLSVIGDLATLTANSGKDMYIARAKCVIYLNAVRTSSAVDSVVLKINGVVVETATSTMQGSDTSQDSGLNAFVYEFKNMGHKVAATQIIKLVVVTLSGNADVEGFIECFEEDTGINPLDDFT